MAGVCGFVSRRDNEYIASARRVMFVRCTVGGGSVGLVLVFAAPHSEMALRSVL